MHVKSDDLGGERNEMPGFPANLQTRLAVEELLVISWASSVKWDRCPTLHGTVTGSVGGGVTASQEASSSSLPESSTLRTVDKWNLPVGSEGGHRKVSDPGF